MAAIELGDVMTAVLPAGLRRLLALAGSAGAAVGVRAYLVGGTVRDLLVGRTAREVDLVVEGDAATLAAELGQRLGVAVTSHAEFGTATVWLPWDRWDDVATVAPGMPALRLDLATARTEWYQHAGALPTVRLGADLVTDLRRRDFTINAMAVALTAGEEGNLIDPLGGMADLAAGRLAVLHAASFEDDPTRLLRGVRLAGRLWLRFAFDTEWLAREAVTHGRLALVSGDRRRHELELLLAEEQAPLALALARTLGLLEQIDPALSWDAWLAERFSRSANWAEAPPRGLVRMALLAYRWPRDTIEGFVARLRPDGTSQAVLEALPVWRERRAHLETATTGSAVAELLMGLPEGLLAAARLAEDEPAVARNLDWYVLELRSRRPRLGGMALRQLGLTPGPRYRVLLSALRRAVLDGHLPDEEAEWAFLRDLIAADGAVIIEPGQRSGATQGEE